jgi:hypothetical protein
MRRLLGWEVRGKAGDRIDRELAGWGVVVPSPTAVTERVPGGQS